MSRWTMPASWAWASPASTWSTTGTVSRGSGRIPALDGALQVQSLEELEGHEGAVLVLPELVDGHDVRMLEAGGRPSLALEAGQRVGIRVFCRHHLQGDVPIEGLVPAPVDRAHGALAELAQHAVTPDPRRESHAG